MAYKDVKGKENAGSVKKRRGVSLSSVGCPPAPARRRPPREGGGALELSNTSSNVNRIQKQGEVFFFFPPECEASRSIWTFGFFLGLAKARKQQHAFSFFKSSGKLDLAWTLAQDGKAISGRAMLKPRENGWKVGKGVFFSFRSVELVWSVCVRRFCFFFAFVRGGK